MKDKKESNDHIDLNSENKEKVTDKNNNMNSQKKQYF